MRVSRAVFRYRMITAVRRQAKVSKTETIVLSMISAKSIESIEKRESDSVFARRGKKTPFLHLFGKLFIEASKFYSKSFCREGF